MIETQGLTHIHIAVRDLQRSVAFYHDVFGMEVMERGDPTAVFMRTPGSNQAVSSSPAARNSSSIACCCATPSIGQGWLVMRRETRTVSACRHRAV